MNSRSTRVTMTLAAVVVVGGIVLHFQNRRRPQIVDTVAANSQKSDSVPSDNFSARDRTAPASEEIDPQADSEAADPLQMPREKIEEYLKLHNRDSASLLAAFHAASDPEHPGQCLEYLK